MRPYEVTVQATADASGVAAVRFVGPGEAWDVLHVDVISMESTSALLPTASLYRGDAATGRRLAVNLDGIGGSFDGGASSDRIQSGEMWSLQWTGATPGATCSATLSGTVRRRGT